MAAPGRPSYQSGLAVKRPSDRSCCNAAILQGPVARTASGRPGPVENRTYSLGTFCPVEM
jgi:hypothetical protein